MQKANWVILTRIPEQDQSRKDSEVILRQGSGPISQRKGPVMTFTSRSLADIYAQGNLWLPGVIGWRVDLLGIEGETVMVNVDEEPP